MVKSSHKDIVTLQNNTSFKPGNIFDSKQSLEDAISVNLTKEPSLVLPEINKDDKSKTPIDFNNAFMRK